MLRAMQRVRLRSRVGSCRAVVSTLCCNICRCFVATLALWKRSALGILLLCAADQLHMPCPIHTDDRELLARQTLTSCARRFCGSCRCSRAESRMRILLLPWAPRCLGLCEHFLTMRSQICKCAATFTLIVLPWRGTLSRAERLDICHS